MSRTGVLLVNTGTPRSAEVADVRSYLAQFLSDPKVIDIHPWLRWWLLHLIILPFRPRRSAAAYRAIWTPQGSPLLVHSLELTTQLQAALGDRAVVRMAMQFGAPSIGGTLDELAQAGVDRLVVLPLFPQYAAASWGSAAQAVMAAAGGRWTVPSVQLIEPFWHQPEFLDLQAQTLRSAIDREQPDHVLFSYHGVPERHCTKTDLGGAHCLRSTTCCAQLVDANRHCYRAQCFATTRELVARLGLADGSYTVAFQSRLGRTPWILPHTDTVLTELGVKKVGKLLVAEPSFVADCLETLEEIGLRGREDFRTAGGGDLVLVPALNGDPAWAKALAGLLQRSSVWLQSS